MSINFYRAFEDRFRGSRESIKSRLRIYLPFIEPLKDIYPDAQGVDLGCGRGEWLELLSENDFFAQGVDLDDDMLAACRGLSLRVQTGEAVSFLKSLPDQSQAVISGFHLAEHIPFDDLLTLVEESLRVLKPAGLLILETPNPENIVVGTSNFYLDPTHQRPIPPQLLAFLPEYYGFGKVKILRLQESVELANSKHLSLLNVLNGVSPDYAVVAQKTAEDELLSLTSQAFEAEYGVTLERLATTYEQHVKQVEAHSQWLQNEWDAAKARLEKLAGGLATAKTNAKHLSAQLNDKIAALERSQAALAHLEELAGDLATAKTNSEHLEAQLNEKTEALERSQAALAHLEELAGDLATAKTNSEHLEAQLNEKTEALERSQAVLAANQVYSQWLQNEREELACKLATAKTNVEHLEARLNEKTEALERSQAKLGEQQAHSQRLQNEWDAAKLKIDELNHSSHHWWTVAENLNQELQAIYNSKFWFITWPLRKLMQIFKWLLYLPIRIILWFVHLPKRTIRWLLVKIMVFVMRRPGLKIRAMTWLRKHPRLYDRLRQLAQARGLVANSPPISVQPEPVSNATGNEATTSSGEVSNLSSSARRIYGELKAAMAQRQKDNG